MGDTGIRRSIVGNLSALYPGIYDNTNIALVGTHQHSGVGGYLEVSLLSVVAARTVQATLGGLRPCERSYATWYRILLRRLGSGLSATAALVPVLDHVSLPCLALPLLCRGHFS
jgi:hypothetical protein